MLKLHYWSELDHLHWHLQISEKKIGKRWLHVNNMKFYGQSFILLFVSGRINELRKVPNLSSRNSVL